MSGAEPGGDKQQPFQSPREEAAGFRHWLARNAWRFILLFGGVLLPLALFVELADEVHELEAFHFDAPLLWQMRAIASPGLDAAMVFITRVGYQWGLIPLDIGIVVVLLLIRRWREAAFAALSFVGSALLNMGYVVLAPQLTLPWAVLPIFLGGLGMALIFPILALAVLDMYPSQRGLASSLQAFVQLMISTVVAGVVSPLLNASPLHLALGQAAFFAAGFVFWYWEHHRERAREALRVQAEG